jgi:hypothetical protein
MDGSSVSTPFAVGLAWIITRALYRAVKAIIDQERRKAPHRDPPQEIVKPADRR